LPRAVAKLNRIGFNRLSARFAGRIPPFAIVHHTGRKSGKAFATPIMVFHKGDRWIFALTYGPETDWVKNVIAAGGCWVEYGRKRVDLRDPKLVDAEVAREAIPAPIRRILKLFRVTSFFKLRAQ
jgi:deazaflavin-dependent oxidoreductase (nitroreductase family)